MKIKLFGRTDLHDLFTQTAVLYTKQRFTPFLVFKETESGIEVVIVDRAAALSTYSRSTKIMVQWQGTYGSDFFQMTVGDVLDALESRCSDRCQRT